MHFRPLFVILSVALAAAPAAAEDDAATSADAGARAVEEPAAETPPAETPAAETSAAETPAAETPPEEEESLLPLHPWAVFGIQAGVAVTSGLVTLLPMGSLALAAIPILPGTSPVLGVRGGGEAVLPIWLTLIGLGVVGPPLVFLSGAAVAWLGAWLAEAEAYPWVSLTTAAVLTGVGTVALLVVAGTAKSEIARTVANGDVEGAMFRFLAPIVVGSSVVAVGVPLVTAAAFAIETGELE